MITLYNAVSSDNFIARLDGSEDFISYDIWHDFVELCKNYDTVIMGKNSYDVIQDFDESEKGPFEKLPIKRIVMSRDKNFNPKSGYAVFTSIAEAISLGNNILMTSGPTLNDAFLKEKLIDKIILNKIPVEIKEGIKQFRANPPKMTLESSKDTSHSALLAYKVEY